MAKTIMANSPMSIFVVGFNYKTAHIDLREKFYFQKDLFALYLQDLLTRGFAREAVLISTCNRSELYCEADDVEKIKDWFCAQTTLARAEVEPILYVYQDEKAVAHIMEVACGLDSMVLGEPQILGQMKEAYSESCSAGTVNTMFHRLFQYVFLAAKEIRTTTAIGACPVSVASAAVHFAKQHYPDFANAHIALIGAGDTTMLLMRYISSQINHPVSVVNRSIDKALALMESSSAQVYGLDEMAEVLQQADIVFSATGSATPIISKTSMQNVMQQRGNNPLMFVDIAVPRDIEAAVAELENVKLFCIDDLKIIIEQNRRGREHAADKAHDLILTKSAEFMQEYKSHDKVAHTISAYRAQIEDICRAELHKAKKQLHQGSDADLVLDNFAYAFTKKLLHTPSVQLRQAGAEGRFDLLHFAKKLFAISDTETELS